MATAIKPVDPSVNEFLAALEAKSKKTNLLFRSMYLTGMKNIRDVVPFPRTPGNAEF